ncbi:MAG: EAL domain-containing protein [Lachnospiraceae bacterium]
MDKQLTMLIIDDEEISRSILKEFFQDDYEVTEAQEGEQALKILRDKKHFDVVLLDLIMPVMDGLTFLETMKQDPELKDIPVVVSTQFQDTEHENRALELGAEDFIRKPYDSRVVRQRVENVIKRCKYDRTMVERTMEQLSYRAQHDVLTGLYHSESFYEEAYNFICARNNEQCVVCIWDIDRFKVVNELFGSSTGDLVLCRLAEQLRTLIGEEGVCARAGSDRFAFVTVKRYFDSVLPQIEQILEGRGNWNPIDYTLQMHMGVYVIDDIKVPIGLMCDRADMALQMVKGNYLKHYSFYSEELKNTMLSEQELTCEMENALREEQFMILLQPIVETATGRTIGAEALIRWNHPAKGMINPGIFLPIFEKNGFISMLDLFVCEQVCKFQRRQIDQNLPTVPISINISRVNFYKPEFVQEIRRLTQEYDIDPTLIKIEITEGAYEDNPQYMMEAIKDFQASSFKILMDDFGSGYSSLNMLKDFNVDVLKIDMKFVNDLETSDRANNILFFILQMAKALKMETVAEGVETKLQYELLASMGCDSIQGYLFSRPITQEDFRNRLNEEKDKVFTPYTPEYDRAVLVVDDQKVHRQIVRKMVSERYRVIEASDGEEAFEILKKHFNNISLVIADIRMPKMGGLELKEKMNDMIYLREIPTIMVTAHGERENEEKALSLGALEIITKPFDAQLARKRIENILKLSESEEKVRQLQRLRNSAGQ